MKDILSEIATSTAQAIGTDFLASLVRSMRDAMDAKVVFITAGIGDPARRARSIASWQQDGTANIEEYDLDGTPCQLVYEGKTVIITEGLYRKFSNEDGYEGYIGVPLCNGQGKAIGHLAVLSDRPIPSAERSLAVVKLFGLRAETELQRLDYEREREVYIASLARMNRRLATRQNLMRESNEIKTILLGMIAHDLRNPLAAILNRSELIQSLLNRTVEDADYMRRAHDSCESIIDSVERIDRHIESVMLQASSEASSINIDVHEFPVSRPIESAHALNVIAARKKSISIHYDGLPDLQLRGDEDRIAEALDNLLRNAVKYSSPGQDIHIGVNAIGMQCEFFVRDSGQGLSQEDCSRAFRQFQRLSAKPTAGESSTGLGLAIVKAIAEAHGGTASVASAGKGKGATFTIIIPGLL